MQIYALPNHVIVKVEEKKKVTDGGLQLPESAVPKQTGGVVMFVEAPRTSPSTGEPIQRIIEVEDYVLFSKHAGDLVEIFSEQYLSVSIGNCFAVIRLEDADKAELAASSIRNETNRSLEA